MRLRNSVALVLVLVACSSTRGATRTSSVPRTAMDDLKKEYDACNANLEESRRNLAQQKAGQANADPSSAAYYQRRMKAYNDIAERLRSAFSPAPVRVDLRDDLLVAHLPESTMFDSSRRQLKPSGESALRSLAEVLKQLPDREFMVASYTDSIPVKKDSKASNDNRKYKENWELSSYRALAVVQYLDHMGVAPQSIATVGSDKNHPIADNGTAEGRAANRRTEIIFLPTIDEMPAMAVQGSSGPSARR